MFFAFVIIALLAGISYTWLIRMIYSTWLQVPVHIIPKAYRPKAAVTILVPARNESDHILSCIESLLDQVWPKELLEIIILDDHSTDDTAELVQSLQSNQIKLVRMEQVMPDYTGPAFKKMALTYGVDLASGQYILTTDADCTHHKHWVASMVSLAETQQKEYVTGPVRISIPDIALLKYQALDTLGMNAVNASGLHRGTRAVSNGANTLYTKNIFKAVHGYQDADQIATGDDVFLVEKIMQHNPDCIAYNKSKEAIVNTHGEQSLSAIIRQRHRWAAKFKKMQSRNTRGIMLFIGFYYIMFWGSILAGVFLDYHYFFLTAILFFFKLRIDFWYLRQLTTEFQQSIMSGFLPAVFLGYFVDPVVALLSLFKPSYSWKGRVTR